MSPHIISAAEVREFSAFCLFSRRFDPKEAWRCDDVMMASWWWRLCVSNMFPRCPPVNLNLLMCSDGDPDPANILKVTMLHFHSEWHHYIISNSKLDLSDSVTAGRRADRHHDNSNYNNATVKETNSFEFKFFAGHSCDKGSGGQSGGQTIISVFFFFIVSCQRQL